MKTVLYGGAFNPPHCEHINIALHALQEGFDRVVFVISGTPPHKKCSVSMQDRAAMLQIATRGDKRFSIDYTELGRQGVNYAVDIIPLLLDKYKDCVYLIGGDSLIDLHKWREPEKIVRMCPILVCSRGRRSDEEQQAYKYWTERGADISFMDYKPEDISSTLARYRARLGMYDGLDEQVSNYIREHALYSDYDEYKNELKKHVKPARYSHCLRTCEYALYLNYVCRLGLDYDKVLLAGLLHDCGKGSSVFDRNKALRPLPEGADDEDRQIVEQTAAYDESLIPQDAVNKPVEHQFVGAVLAQSLFGINDDEILGAIRYHCTGKADMSVIEKLIFSADMLERGRDYPGVQDMRDLIEKDFEAGFVSCLKSARDNVIAKGGSMYPLTQQAWDYYKNGFAE